MIRNVASANNSIVLIKFLMMSSPQIEIMLVQLKENVSSHVMIKSTILGIYAISMVSLCLKKDRIIEKIFL